MKNITLPIEFCFKKSSETILENIANMPNI